MRKTSRSAFTLFELLVLLAILGLLLALLMPAVAKVRQAASRAQSLNNIKQLGIACHNYHDSFGSFPPGNDDNNFSALARLLPFIEQDNLYKQIDFKKAVTDEANAHVRNVRIKVFENPQDPIPFVSEEWGPTNYVMNAGPEPALADNKGGIFYQDSKVKLTDIANADGTSNTIMTGETLKGDGGTKAVDVRRQLVQLKKEALKNLKEDSGVKDFADNKNIVGNRCASWMDGRFLQTTFTGTRVPNDKRPDVNCGGMGGLSALRTLAPRLNVGFCDGSARTLNINIELKVWKDLTNYLDGNVIPANVFSD